MKYQIGQVAKLLDISAQGLRLYEKEGIIQPEREESGYRSYNRLDITSLLPTIVVYRRAALGNRVVEQDHR